MATNEGQAALTVRIDADTFRRTKIESIESGQTLRQLVQIALEDLLERRKEERRELARGGF